MQSVFPHDDFQKKIVRRKRSSRKRRPHVGKFKRSGIEVCVQPGFSPNLVDTVTFGNVCDDGSKAKTRKVDKFYVDVPYENSVHDGLRADQNIDADGSSSLPQGFITNDVPQNRIASSSKYTPHAEITKLVSCGTVTSGKSSDDGLKTSKGDNIVGEDVPSDFIPKLVGCTVTIGKSSDDGSKSSKGGNIVDNVVPFVRDGIKAGGNIDADGGNNVDDDVLFVQDGMKVGGNIDPDGRSIVDDVDPSGSIPKLLRTISSENSVEDGLMAEKDVDSDAHSVLPLKGNTLTPLISVEDRKHVPENVQFEEEANGSKEARLSSDTIGQFETQMESYGYLSEVSVAELEQRIKQLERVQRKRKRARLLQ